MGDGAAAKVLILDKSAEVRETYKRYLQAASAAYDCIEADTLNLGVKYCLAYQPDCILLDYPQFDPQQFCTALKQSSAYRRSSLPIVAITAATSSDIAVQALKLGAADYLSKQHLTRRTLIKVVDATVLRVRDVAADKPVGVPHQRLTLIGSEGRDVLTGLKSRIEFDQQLSHLAVNQGELASKIAVLIMEIEDFNRYREIYGQVAADRCLGQIAAMLQRTFRDAGLLLARFGTHEFAAILHGEQAAHATSMATQVQADLFALNIQHVRARKQSRLSFNIGVGMSDGSCDPWFALYRAEQSLSQAKAVAGPPQYAKDSRLSYDFS